MNKKLSVSLIVFLFTIIFFSLALEVKAWAATEYDKSSHELGFDISTEDFYNFQYATKPSSSVVGNKNTRIDITCSYDGYFCGSAMIEFVFCQAKQHIKNVISSTKYDYSILLLRGARITVFPKKINYPKSFLFVNWTKTMQFGVDDVQVKAFYQNYDDLRRGIIFSTRGSNTAVSTSGDLATNTENVSMGFGAFGISYDITNSVDRYIVEYANYSNSDEMFIDFDFNTPKTDSQNHFIFNQSRFYVMDSFYLRPDINTYNFGAYWYNIQLACGSEKSNSVSNYAYNIVERMTIKK